MWAGEEIGECLLEAQPLSPHSMSTTACPVISVQVVMTELELIISRCALQTASKLEVSIADPLITHQALPEPARTLTRV